MNREIPGFYYDSAKRKYFRIEDSRTAPAQAAWSAQNVKRRAVEREEDVRKRERARSLAGRVRRARVLEGVPLMGGLLAREAGLPPPTAAGETLARAWAERLRAKGVVKLWPWISGDRGPPVTAMWVGPSATRSGLGVVFGTSDNVDALAGSYIPRDADDRVNFQDGAQRYPGLDFQPFGFPPGLGRITDIKFHEPSFTVLLACEHPGGLGVGINSITQSRGGSGSRASSAPDGWGLLNGPFRHDSSASAIHALRPAPAGSRLTCIAGTNAGIIQLQDDKVTWLTPPPSSGRRHPKRQQPRQQRRNKQGDAGDLPPWQGDILSVDFLDQNPTELILAGTRSSHVCLLDLRVPPREWSPENNTFKHASSAAHVRSVGAYNVLVAGPRSAMALYDVRYLRQRQQQEQQTPHHQNGYQYKNKWNANATHPLFTFPAYHNEAHIHTGLDVLTSPAGYGECGIVAAAHSGDNNNNNNGDGTVGLYSLRDGSRIPGGEVDGIRASAVVKSLVWQTLAGDWHPSLFVGEGSAVKKYSFWA
ncbi:hypothetical protein C8A01DRAFT_17014 [Parachaetomium inaequale]|uniref:Myocyte-specific enhancer factor 2d n=1 Tax=Parachaetomium inaequale TaxID=2588326 RepID=A0AAN6PI09_9PEZI|nr:hypothetical protein C8A01DRAFT_17014 [Parachaetomium inaequale]